MKKLSSYLYEGGNLSGLSKATQNAAERLKGKKVPTPASVKTQINKDKDKNWDDNLTAVDGEVMDYKDALKELENGNGAIDIEAPNGEKLKVTKESSWNLKRLKQKFWDEEPFFIQGEAGWAKTQIIKKMAKSEGYYIITVYLDKAEATDLGGIPVAQEKIYGKGKNGVDKKGADMTYAMPVWGSVIRENPEKKFLLFFDEFNQAKPDVMNALMPIVLENTICGKKMPNFLVGAAGNFDYENLDGIQDIRANDALLSRFLPLIIWESDTKQTWKETFDHLHSVWDEKIGAKFIDAIEKCKSIFKNPREIEHKMIAAFFKEMKRPKEEREELVDSEWVMDKIARVALHRETSHTDWSQDDSSSHLSKDGRKSAFAEQSAEQQAAELADFIADCVIKAEYDEDTDSVTYDTDKTIDSELDTGDDEIAVDETFVDEKVASRLKTGRLEDRYRVNGKVVYMGISLENWSKVIQWGGETGDDEGRDLTAQEVEYVNDMIEEKGIKVRFKTNADFLKLPDYMDPASLEEAPEIVK